MVQCQLSLVRKCLFTRVWFFERLEDLKFWLKDYLVHHHCP